MKLLRIWFWTLTLSVLLAYLFSVLMVIGNIIYDIAPFSFVAVSFVAGTLLLSYLIKEATTL